MTAFSHLGICVSDLEASLRFYCDGLGFAVAEGYDLDDATAPGIDRALEVEAPVALRSQMITKGDLKIELLAFSAPTPDGHPSASRSQLGLTHLSFTVDDVDATIETLVAAGGTLLESTRASLGIELVFLTDPDGTRIELMG